MRPRYNSVNRTTADVGEEGGEGEGEEEGGEEVES